MPHLATKPTLFWTIKFSALLDDHRTILHTATAKLLYLAKRARPIILTVTSFICTRTEMAIEEELQKLVYTLGYLHATHQTALILRPTKPLKLTLMLPSWLMMIQKSHSGVAVFVAGVLVYIITKTKVHDNMSPTESECVALTDNLGLAALFLAIIYQDCMVVIQLVTTGGGIVCTKLLRV